MPDKEGSEDEKTTKGVVKKKRKQMMGEEGYDTYRDNILMRGGDHRSKETKEKSYTPSEQPKGQTAAQKAAKGKSALELVKADITKKYGKGAIMDVKKKSKKKANEELDLTKIAEAFGGCVIETLDPTKDARQRALMNRILGGDKRTPEEIDADIEKERSEEGRAREEAQKTTQTMIKKGKRRIKKQFQKVTEPKPGEKESQEKIIRDKLDALKKSDETFAAKQKTFKQAFGTPTGADPVTGRPTYSPPRIQSRGPKDAQDAPSKRITLTPSFSFTAPGSEQELSKRKRGPESELPKGKGGGVPTGDQYEKSGKKLGEREAARSVYLDQRKKIDGKSNPNYMKASDQGAREYFKKSMQMRSGSNEPISDAEIDRRLSLPGAMDDVKGKINQKYAGRQAKLRRSGSKTYDELMGDIDQREAQKNTKVRDEVRGETGQKERPLPGDPQSGSMKDTFKRTEKAQQSIGGSVLGFLAKSAFPASAGLEASQRLKQGRKFDAGVSAVQAMGIPGVSMAAGVLNAIRSIRAGQGAAAATAGAIGGGGKGGGKKPKVASGDETPSVNPVTGAIMGDADTQDVLFATGLPKVGEKLKQARGLPGVTGGRVGRRSAPS